MSSVPGASRNDGGSRQPGGSRGRSSSGRGSRNGKQAERTVQTQQERVQAFEATARAAALRAAEQDQQEDGDGLTCFICATPARYWAFGKCSHPSCHTCAIRLRALYKQKHCSMCKTELERMVVTEDSEKPFAQFSPQDTPFADEKLGMSFETREMLEDTLALLRFNCPSCEQQCGNWGDLRRHVRAEHHRLLCSLCTRYQKIFTFEHTLFTPVELQQHIAAGNSEVDIDTGFTGHPTCEFCRAKYPGPGQLERHTFFDIDALYAHLKQSHEQCFICIKSADRNVRDTYYVDNEDLQKHYREKHYICPDPGCLEKKMIVFGTPLDLQAHQLEEHGISDKRQGRDARRVETHFTFDRPQAGPSRGGRRQQQQQNGWPSTADDESRDRRPPSPVMLPVETPEPARAPPGVPLGAGGRVVPGLGPAAQSSRRINFSSQLTAPTPAARPTTPSPEVTERHNALLARVASLVNESASKLTSFKGAVKSYRSAEMSAHDLLDILYSILDRNVDHVGIIAKGVADLLDNESKKTDLLEAWREFRSENENAFPSLTPVAPTVNGTAVGASPRAAHRPKRDAAVWARVQQAASSYQPVRPALKAIVPGQKRAVAPRKGIPGSTPWAASRAAIPSAPIRPVGPQPTGGPVVPPQPSPYTETLGGPTLVLGRRVNIRPQPPSTHDFPGLPSSSYAAREARTAALGLPTPKRTNPSTWGKTPSGQTSPSATATTNDGFSMSDLDAAIAASNQPATVASTSGGGRRGNKKGQILFRM